MTEARNARIGPAPTTGSPPPEGGGTPASPATRVWRYENLDEIARGGMGVVYRARDTVLRREVVVKVLQERFATDSAAARRFVEEARITGQLQHPCIPAVHDLGTLPDGRPFLAMKLIKGRTLTDLLEGYYSWREPTIATLFIPRPTLTDLPEGGGSCNLTAVFEQVCQAVGYAHARGVIHRDLKPANVMVGAFGEVQVMDWGLAKVLASGGREPPADDPEATTAVATEIQTQRGEDEATRAGSVLGTPACTPAYMPPEQAIGAVDQVDARSDVFGLGALLCAILTGKPPYVGADSESTRQLAARARLDDAFARLDASRGEPGLVALCKRCLSAEKADRPADAGEVARKVARLRAAAEERARQAELDRERAKGERLRAEGERLRAEAEAREQGKRRRAQLGMAAAVGLLLLGGGASAWYWDRQATQRRFEAEERVRDEQARLDRNTEALAELIDRCEAAVRNGDAGPAALALGQAERRLAEGGGEALRARVGRCAADLALLRELDAIDTFRWTVVDTRFPDDKAVASRLQSALAGYGLSGEKVTAREAAGRVVGSLVRERLLTALDLLLSTEPSAPVREILRSGDPDTYREAVRDAVMSRNRARQAELAGRPAALEQPPWFAAVLGQNRAVPAERRRVVLEAALRPRPGDLGLLMELGVSYPINQGESAHKCARWYQAAVAAHPLSIAAHNGLGIALAPQGDLAGAVACFKEAIRLDPKSALTHTGLRNTETLRQVLPRLADVLAGRAEPKSPAEGCTFALVCVLPFQKRYAAAARLYEKAFAGDAKLADDLRDQHRYNAACAAALAGRGDGVDAPAGPAGRAALRATAMAWLRADLALYRKQAASSDATQRQFAAARLTHWLVDGDLAGLRTGMGRIGMPAAERGEWDALWADVRATLAEARKPPSREPKKP